MATHGTAMEQLDKPLEADRVKQRRQGGRMISYLEGYDVIDRANAIFGFDGWSYRLIESSFVRMGDAGFYQATVEVETLGVTRRDVGVGDVTVPRDRTLDEASADAFGTALKGAVTDGLKRCLRTFGSQFGNSLYDKDDPAHAGEAAAAADATAGSRAPAKTAPKVPAGESRECPNCGSSMTLRSGTTKDGRPYTAWFCNSKCGSKPVWVNEREPF